MIEIPLPCGMKALVDEADAAEVRRYKWCARKSRNGKTFYVQRNVSLGDRRTVQQLHQFITGATGVDHINGNGLDNRRSNLRVANQSQNSANTGPRSGKYKGVTQRPNGRWRAQIRIDWHQMQIGTYDTAEDAARAYDARALEAWGEFAYLNFPNEAKRTA